MCFADVVELFPAIDPFSSGSLSVGDGHHLYWEIVGAIDGEAALMLHGGPGSGCTEGHRRWFDPSRFRAVLFDQRGCGRSTPLADTASADLSSNTTSHLIDDIEQLRNDLDIEQWLVVGSSWGVTLALAYAQEHPERVSRMVLAAVTTGRRFETEWITESMRRVFPREWAEFVEPVSDTAGRGRLAAAYAELLSSPDPVVTAQAALSWCRWEDTHVSLAPRAKPHYELMALRQQQVTARLVSHYWANGCFLDERPILDRMANIDHIPATLIHGRLDVSSPLDTAWDLHDRWPASTLRVLDDAGHGGASMVNEIVHAINHPDSATRQTEHPRPIGNR